MSEVSIFSKTIVISNENLKLSQNLTMSEWTEKASNGASLCTYIHKTGQHKNKVCSLPCDDSKLCTKHNSKEISRITIIKKKLERKASSEFPNKNQDENFKKLLTFREWREKTRKVGKLCNHIEFGTLVCSSKSCVGVKANGKTFDKCFAHIDEEKL